MLFSWASQTAAAQNFPAGGSVHTRPNNIAEEHAQLHDCLAAADREAAEYMNKSLDSTAAANKIDRFHNKAQVLQIRGRQADRNTAHGGNEKL